MSSSITHFNGNFMSRGYKWLFVDYTILVLSPSFLLCLHVCRYSLNKDASSNMFLFPAPSALGQLLSHLPSLLSLNLQSCSLLDDATLLPLSSSSPYLTSLTLSGCSLVSDPSLLAIASRLSYLQALGLAYTQVSLLILLYCIKALHTHSILTSYE